MNRHHRVPPLNKMNVNHRMLQVNTCLSLQIAVFARISVLGPSHSKHSWCHPFFGGAYLHPNQTYPLLQQEEYVKYFSKFLYNKDNRFRNNPRYRPRPPPQRYRRNYNSYKPYRRRVRSRSSSESSSSSSSKSRRRSSSTRSTHKSRRS